LAKGEIHDLGYQRYVGARRPASTRWRVIARHQVATAWKTWWRYKAALGFAVIMLCVYAGLLMFGSAITFQQGGASMMKQMMSDAAVPMSIEWFVRGAFYLSLTLGAGLIASDMQSGAFTFYFARSTRPRDYALGKLAGYGTLVATLALLPPLVLAGLRVGVCETSSEVMSHLYLIPAALVVGLVATIAYSVIPLGFSALLPDRRNALALWAAYYLVFGTVMQLIGRHGGSWAALDLPTAVLTIAFDLFDFQPIFGRRAARALSPSIAWISIAVQAAVAIGIIWWRVSRAQKQGVVGSS
jgi:hypothetical protein